MKRKIIAWNCQGAFRKKYKQILELEPDILIISECESEEKLRFGELTPTPNDFIWYSSSGKKGLGIFSYSDYRLELMKEFNPKYRYVLPIKVSNNEERFLLFAIWAMNNKENPSMRYIAQVWQAIHYYNHLFNLNVVLIGDFNSNKIWDHDGYSGNHTDVVTFLENKHINSLYHIENNVLHGKESEYTFFMQHNLEKAYHTDYCFVSESFLDMNARLLLGNPIDWIEYSDHMPLILSYDPIVMCLDFENSFLKFVDRKVDSFSLITQKKFSDWIENLKKKASRIEQDDLDDVQRIELVEAMEYLSEIDKKIVEIHKYIMNK